MIRVGVVDDQPLLVAAFRALVDAQPDLTVTGVGATGQDAIVLAQAGEVDVLLLDIRMPGMDGLATLEALAGRAPRPTLAARSRHLGIRISAPYRDDDRATSQRRCRHRRTGHRLCTHPCTVH